MTPKPAQAPSEEALPRPQAAPTQGALDLVERIGRTVFVFDDWRTRIAGAIDELGAQRLTAALLDPSAIEAGARVITLPSDDPDRWKWNLKTAEACLRAGRAAAMRITE